MISANQKPTTIDIAHHERYRVLAGGLVTMADMRRAAHNLYLGTQDTRQRAQIRLRGQGVYMSDVELVQRLLRMVIYGKVTIVVNEVDYSSAG